MPMDMNKILELAKFFAVVHKSNGEFFMNRSLLIRNQIVFHYTYTHTSFESHVGRKERDNNEKRLSRERETK